jgi:hypothetical protein
MPFEEGKSGNPGGRPKRIKMTFDALMVELKSREQGDDPRGLRKVVQKVVDLAEGGERWAVEFIRDTIDGKPAQTIIGDNDADPVNHKVEMDAERFTRQLASVIARSGAGNDPGKPAAGD